MTQQILVPQIVKLVKMIIYRVENIFSSRWTESFVDSGFFQTPQVNVLLEKPMVTSVTQMYANKWEATATAVSLLKRAALPSPCPN